MSSPCYSSLASWPDSPLSSPSTRVFLHISYDFADDRINGLAAHVTNRRSRYRIRHRNGQTQERISSTEWSPIDDNHSVNISRFLFEDPSDNDNHEREMIESFLSQLSQEIVNLNGQYSDAIAVHLYFQTEIDCRYLMDACRRAGTTALRRLNNLLGLRSGLQENVAFSCVIPDIKIRFALPFVAGNLYALTQVSNFAELVERDDFEDDGFDWTFQPNDYNQALNLGELFQGKDHSLEYLGLDGTDNAVRFQNGRDRAWAETGGLPPRFFWQLWGRLDNDGQELGANYSNESEREYLQRCSTPEMLTAYAELQTKGLRWVVERVTPLGSNNTPVPNFYPQDFDLIGAEIDTDTPSAAALEFARLEDFAVKLDWERERLKPLNQQVISGKTLTLRNLRPNPDDDQILIAEVDSTGLTFLNEGDVINMLQIAAGKYVRLVHQNAEARWLGGGHSHAEILRHRTNNYGVQTPQHTVGRFLGIVGNTAQFAVTYPSQDGSNHSSDWEWARYGPPFIYRSYRFQGSTTYWTMSESPDTIAGARIEDELEFANATNPQAMHGAHVNVWFDQRENAGNIPPYINLTQEEANHIEGILQNLEFDGGPFNQESIETILSMLRGESKF